MKQKIIIFDTGIIDNINQKIKNILSSKFDCEIYYLYRNYRKFEQSSFIVKPFFIFFEFFRLLFYIRRSKPKVSIIRGGSMFYYSFLISLLKVFNKEGKIILCKYDIDNFRQYSDNLYSNLFLYLNKLTEKYFFYNVDKIIHKGLENELEFLDFYDKIKDKPHYLFREFIDESLIQEYNPEMKLSKKDGEIHLCYGGCIHQRDDFYHERTVNLFKRIIKNEIHLHVYSRMKDDFKDILEHPYFHYEGFKKYEDLIKEYTKYDFGIYLYGRTDNMFQGNGNNIWDKTGFSNKIYDYIHACLPILYSDNLKAISNFLDENKLGIKDDYINFDFSKLRNFDIEEYLENRKIFLENYNNDKFIKFIGQVVS